MYAFPRVVAEIVRLCPEPARHGAFVTLSLSDVPGAGSRSRGSAVYWVGVAFSWRPDLGVVKVATPAGRLAEWTFSEVAAWLEKTLAGWPVVVALEFNAGKLSPNWVGRRLQRQTDYMAAVLPGDLRQGATDRRAAVAALPVDAGRRLAAEAAADVLDGVAALVETLGVAP
jgi:hypothetical protein